ncbi:hypothetical protein M3Y99_00935200 [Aphelenchoides fujianensis]|nr:hypothetical protein M3Y99_00935200 [Aphelenchoides fujianensis]
MPKTIVIGALLLALLSAFAAGHPLVRRETAELPAVQEQHSSGTLTNDPVFFVCLAILIGIVICGSCYAMPRANKPPAHGSWPLRSPSRLPNANWALRWFLLNDATWGFFLDTALCLLQPLFFFPGPQCGMSSSTFLRHTNFRLAQCFIVAVFSTVLAKIHAFSFALVHRFVCAHPPNCRLARVYGRCTPWLQIALLVVPLGLLAVPLGLLVGVQLPSIPTVPQDHLRVVEQVIAINPHMAAVYAEEETALCVLGSTHKEVFSEVYLNIFAFSSVLFGIFDLLLGYTRHLLQRQAAMIHDEHMLKLQQMLLRACVAQMVGLGLFLVLPFAGLIVIMRTGPTDHQLLTTIAVCFLSKHTAFNSICLMLFIPPYREYLLDGTSKLILLSPLNRFSSVRQQVLRFRTSHNFAVVVSPAAIQNNHPTTVLRRITAP